MQVHNLIAKASLLAWCERLSYYTQALLIFLLFLCISDLTFPASHNLGNYKLSWHEEILRHEPSSLNLTPEFWSIVLVFIYSFVASLGF